MTKEKIISNTKKYLERAEKYGATTPELQTFLGENFIKAPASSFTHLHNCFEGGLIDHLLRVTKHMFLINKNNFSDGLRVSEASLIRVGLLHGIGKANLYIPETNDWWIKNKGRLYEFNNDLASMDVGERSVYYALSNGVELTDEECSAILNYDKLDDSKAEWHNTTVGDLLKLAIRISILEEKQMIK
tara:strand:+ start:5184 stop:5747 length:564 start_codon:yes stop_codon:yes gene_type:complete